MNDLPFSGVGRTSQAVRRLQQDAQANRPTRTNTANVSEHPLGAEIQPTAQPGQNRRPTANDFVPRYG